MRCDPVTGACIIEPLPETQEATSAPSADREIIYVGDPMCSWCWGMSPALKALEAEGCRRGLPFRVVVGGLRAGGGERWDDRFRNFLREHWEEIVERTGQPFSMKLLELESFDYDTEPGCRAVVVARDLLEPSKVYDFFSAVQERIYAHGEDPKPVGFYRELCARFGIDFDVFRERFESDEARAKTGDEFRLVRSWGVRSFPTVLLRDGPDLRPIALGFATAEQMIAALDQPSGVKLAGH